MKPHKFTSNLLTTLSLLSLTPPLTKSQDDSCPFTGFLDISADDTTPPETELGSKQVTDPITITGISIVDEEFNSVLTPHYESTEDGYRIYATPIQPNFADLVDYKGYSRPRTTERYQGLKIDVDGGPSRFCFLRLAITDTNNRRPEFSKSDLEFPISTTWDTRIPLNYDITDPLHVTDQDLTPPLLITFRTSKSDDSSPEIKVDQQKISDWSVENPHTYDIKISLDSPPVQGTHVYEIIPIDGDNEGDPLTVTITITQDDSYEPRFESKQYVKIFDKMPEGSDVLDDLEIKAYDPDFELIGEESTFEYTVENSDYLDFNENDKLYFTRPIPELLGKTVELDLLALQQGTPEPARTTIKLIFPKPTPPKFPKNVNPIQLTHWPTANERVDIGAATPAVPGMGIAYEFGDTKPETDPVNLIDIEYDDTDGNLYMTFREDMDAEKLGALGGNRVVVFDVVGFYVDEASVSGVGSFVVTFPVDDDLGSTTDSSSTTEVTDGSSGTTEVTGGTSGTTEVTGDTSGTTEVTGNTSGTTEVTGDTSGTTEVTDGSSGTTEVTSDTSGTTEMTTEATGTTNTECPICSTEITTTEPVCNTEPTECTPLPCDCSTCATDQTWSSTEATEPTDQTDTPEPCPSTTESTCNPATDCPPTTECPPNTTPCPEPPVCTTEPPVCPPSSTEEPCPSTCEPCDSKEEEDECSNTGLVIAVIATSVLCVAGICSTGLSLWLLRKATVDPTRFQRESLLSTSSIQVDTEKPPPPQPQTVEPPKRQSFGDTPQPRFTTPQLQEPGYANPTFTDTEHLIASTPSTSDPQPDLYSQPTKKSNIKQPKEIEPDYEELPPETKSPQEADGAAAERARKQSRVLFAPEDEYISIGSDVGEGGVNVGEGDDVEDERL